MIGAWVAWRTEEGETDEDLAGVADKDGKWASGSPWVRTTGGTDVLCDGGTIAGLTLRGMVAMARGD